MGPPEPFDGLLVSFLCTDEFLQKSFRVWHMAEPRQHQPRLPTLYLPTPLWRDPFLSLMVLVRLIGGVALTVPCAWDHRRQCSFDRGTPKIGCAVRKDSPQAPTTILTRPFAASSVFLPDRPRRALGSTALPGLLEWSPSYRHLSR